MKLKILLKIFLEQEPKVIRFGSRLQQCYSKAPFYCDPETVGCRKKGGLIFYRFFSLGVKLEYLTKFFTKSRVNTFCMWNKYFLFYFRHNNCHRKNIEGCGVEEQRSL